jgi:hypothetical protein
MPPGGLGLPRPARVAPRPDVIGLAGHGWLLSYLLLHHFGEGSSTMVLLRSDAIGAALSPVGPAQPFSAASTSSSIFLASPNSIRLFSL